MSTPADASKSGEETREPWIVPRPAEVLLELPVPYRWEFTRRHPYYLRFWEPAHRCHTAPSNDAVQRGLEDSASLIMTLIGVTADPPPPSLTADALEATPLKEAWIGGAVAPVTFRGYATTLLAGLPPDVLDTLGTMLTACAKGDNTTNETRYRLINELKHVSHPALDTFPKGPVVGINLQAPANAILDAIENLVKQWKTEAGIPDQRRRDEKLPEYLKIWDLREGWVGDHYDSREERTFNQISQQLSVPPGTVGNRYRSAFRYIFGRDFTPELWGRVIGFLKLMDWMDRSEIPIRTLTRRWRTPSPNPVSESRVQPSEGNGTVKRLLDTVGISQSEIAMVDLELDLRSLIDEGRTNEEIITELELQSDAASEMIDYLRTRRADAL